jgi:hypothetical protein
MRTERYPARDLIKLFKQHTIATMGQLKEALGTEAEATVFRKLAELSYRTSYSHRGGYYTLDTIPVYDEWGLWSFRSVWFSKRGTLLSTAAQLVDESEAGFSVAELESILHVEAKGALLKLVVKERIGREKFGGRNVYYSRSSAKRKQQLAARRVWESETRLGGPLVEAAVMPNDLKAAIVLFFSLLDEKQRRLYAGLESLKMGHGGERQIADLLGLDAGTVARGRRELLARDVEVERVRKAGGGRKPLEKKRRRSSRKSKRS